MSSPKKNKTTRPFDSSRISFEGNRSQCPPYTAELNLTVPRKLGRSHLLRETLEKQSEL